MGHERETLMVRVVWDVDMCEGGMGHGQQTLKVRAVWNMGN